MFAARGWVCVLWRACVRCWYDVRVACLSSSCVCARPLKRYVVLRSTPARCDGDSVEDADDDALCALGGRCTMGGRACAKRDARMTCDCTLWPPSTGRREHTRRGKVVCRKWHGSEFDCESIIELSLFAILFSLFIVVVTIMRLNHFFVPILVLWQ